jgi:Calcineurin-like phosphoesterase
MSARGIGFGAGRAILAALFVALAGVPGATSASSASGPVSSAPRVAITAGGQLGNVAVPATVSWPAATPDGASITGYELQRSLDAGPWTAVRLAKPLSRSVDSKVPPWAVARFRVRAVDSASVAGEWAESAPIWPTTAQESDTLVVRSAGWSVVSDSSAYRKRRATTTIAGQTATFTFTGRQVAWIARFGPDRGQASVALEGTVTTVNLARPVTSSRRVVFRKIWPSVGAHTLTVTTTSDKPVDVDAFVVLGNPADGHMVGAGDIATCTNSHDSETANLVAGVLSADTSATAFTGGDNVYPDGTAQNFTNCYEPSWGPFKARTRPIPGNHDYLNSPGAGPYFAYFGANAGPAGQGWYRYESGTWRIYALNSECAPDSACFAAQLGWLKTDLAAEPHRCVLAMWHRPRFSTGPHGSSTRMAEVLQTLYDYGADVVVTGHDHGYQRFMPANPSGVADAARGMRQFVVGTGGAELYEWKTDSTLLEVRGNVSFGVLELHLTPGSYSWQFVAVPGPTGFTDSGSEACH